MTATAPTMPEPTRVLVYRHSVLVRITHWINVICIIFLVMSGLQIFNAHPALYIGQQSNFDEPDPEHARVIGEDGQAASRRSSADLQHDRRPRPLHRPTGQPQARGFPRWLTVPSYQDLATGRRWHFFFAWIFVINGLVYLDREPARPPRLARPRAERRARSAASAARSSITSGSASDGDGRDLQRAPEARLSRHHLRRAAAHRPRPG